MPSDLTSLALSALQPAREAFLAAISGAADELRDQLTVPDDAAADGAGRAALELGPFAAGRIDATQFGATFRPAAAVTGPALAVLRRAQETFGELLAAGDAPFLAEVPPGGDLSGVVQAALTRAGRAFGAGRAVELTRSGRVPQEDPLALLDGYAPARWNRAEREIAPPLVVELEGGELRGAGALGELLQGTQKVVLLVRGACPPAALVRLITPGVLVLQAADGEALTRLTAVAGPAVVLVGEGVVAFAHDPAGGARLAERLTVGAVPTEPVRGALGAYTRAQQTEDLAQLAALAEAVRPAPAAAGAVASNPADLLAAWLLGQADLADVG
jgi:hypothetical protein